MVPLAAHEAVVESYEKSSKAALQQAAASSAAGLSALAGDFSERQEALHAQLEGRDASLSKASQDLRDMSDSLAGLKRDVGSLREALSRLCVCVCVSCTGVPRRNALRYLYPAPLVNAFQSWFFFCFFCLLFFSWLEKRPQVCFCSYWCSFLFGPSR